MKNLIPVLAVLAVLMAFTACEVEETYSVRERMKAFIDDANAKSWSDLKAHTHPEANDYNTANADFWETRFSTSVPLDDLTVRGQTATVTGEDDVTFTFYLTADGSDDNLINHIERDGTTVFR